MKVLFLSQGAAVEDHPGWNFSLQRLQAEGVVDDYLNVPYYACVRQLGWEGFYRHVVELCRQREFDVVYFHYFHWTGMATPRKCIGELRTLPSNPVILTSAGDALSDNWMTPGYPAAFKECSRLADITFSTQMGRTADKMVRWGARNVVYTPNSMCPVRFCARHVDVASHRFDFDVVFVGSRNEPRIFNPISKLSWYARRRTQLVHALSRRYGARLGLFGHGWKGLVSWQGPTPFDQQQSTFQRGRVVVGGNPGSFSDYYSSNRVFFEVSSGIPTVELSVPRLDRVLRNQEHCYFCNSTDDIIKTCDSLLEEDPVNLYAKAARAADYIALKHTQYHRMKFKLETAIRYRRNNDSLDVAFPFFLPEVDLAEEKKYALRENRTC